MLHVDSKREKLERNDTFILASVTKGKGHRIVALDIIHVHEQICTHGNKILLAQAYLAEKYNIPLEK